MFYILVIPFDCLLNAYALHIAFGHVGSRL